MEEMLSRTTAVLASRLLAVLVFAAPAHATFPGANGKIAFLSLDQPPTISGHIHAANPDGSDETSLALGIGADWSPNGQKIAYTRLGVYIANADGTSETLVTNKLGPLDPTQYLIDWPAWSPDGSKLVFSGASIGTLNDLYVVNADGTGLTRLTNTPSVYEGAPTWSPDGSKIAFEANSVAIYLMNPDGTDIKQISFSSDGQAFPQWSPDGRKIAFWRSGAIWVMNPDGTGQAQIEPGRAAVWSPDGTQFAFECNLAEICTSGVDGSDTRVVPLAHPSYLPDWQPIPRPHGHDFKNAAQFCKAERGLLGDSTFRQKYGGAANAYGKCVSGK
jgi:dipeptidyl aminopeptidase/acylaminoacyl peptidase